MKLSLGLVSYHNSTEVKLHTFLILALDGGELLMPVSLHSSYSAKKKILVLISFYGT